MMNSAAEAYSAVIKVMGVGGGGNNAVNRMIEAGVQGVQFYAVNTDWQTLCLSQAPSDNRIQIGADLTGGLGAGADPQVGAKAAEESKDILTEAIKGADLLFITAGMGGGTGTGAAPVIARLAHELDILTIAVVTKPFPFEGRKRDEFARQGIANLSKYVDSLVVVPNAKLLKVMPESTTMEEGLRYADDALRQGIQAITEIIIRHSSINLDFADIRTTMKGQGLAHMGMGSARGENRIVEAVRQAVSSPLLETTIEEAKSVILNVRGGKDLRQSEVAEAAQLVQGAVDPSANLIFGYGCDEGISEDVEITVIATGFRDHDAAGEETVEVSIPRRPERIAVPPASPAPTPHSAPEAASIEPPVNASVSDPGGYKPMPEDSASASAEEPPKKKEKELPLFFKKFLGK